MTTLIDENNLHRHMKRTPMLCSACLEEKLPDSEVKRKLFTAEHAEFFRAVGQNLSLARVKAGLDIERIAIALKDESTIIVEANHLTGDHAGQPFDARCSLTWVCPVHSMEFEE